MVASKELNDLWAFSRGDLDAEQFEPLLYESPKIESILGHTLYLDLLSIDFHDRHEVANIRYRLLKQLEVAERSCECITLKNNFGICWSSPEDMPMLATLVTVRSRTPWLHLKRCTKCGDCWLIAEDTVDDDIYFSRLSSDSVDAILNNDHWPTTFDELKNVWPAV